MASPARAQADSQPAHAPLRPLARAEVPRDTVALARYLLGKILVREWPRDSPSPPGQPEQRVSLGRIVETEAYLDTDPACHAFRGMTARNRSLFLDAGHAYVYLCYGVSHLLNVSSEAAGTGSGVLLRALEPLSGTQHLWARPRSRPRARSAPRPRDLLRGPGRLTAALAIDRRHDGIDLFGRGELWLASDDARIDAIGESVRIGLTQAAEARLRFFVKGSAWLSGGRALNA